MTAQSHNTKWYKVNKCFIYPLLTDPEGGTTTYGPGIWVPGIKTLGLGGTVKSEVLRGDSQLLDTDSVLQDLKLTLSHAKLSLDALSVMIGGVVADTGTAPARKAKYSLVKSSRPKYFKLMALTQGIDTEGGAGVLTLWKNKFDAVPALGFADESYHIFNAGATSVPLLGATEAWMDIDLDETEIPLAA